ncbi:DUF167 family protein [Lentilitoribacter sp. Alg239-R112]|jgi:uncharacterized protein YggU (UPF0235/DUF167 family)|uniref:DUF167 family protein n=1 Tax=Lentilitoribacter sp. Alg239-R112 TaxID=2305987 RepID=UPI0013A6BC31|nr:DUF167 family protein [Lentilitoribacter sp. Alg239-R112]
MSWVQGRGDDSSYLFLRLTPNAQHDGINGIYEHADGKNYLQISVRAVPENGKANKAVTVLLAKILSIARSGVKLKSGSKSRFKCIQINMPASLIEQKIESRDI